MTYSSRLKMGNVFIVCELVLKHLIQDSFATWFVEFFGHRWLLDFGYQYAIQPGCVIHQLLPIWQDRGFCNAWSRFIFHFDIFSFSLWRAITWKIFRYFNLEMIKIINLFINTLDMKWETKNRKKKTTWLIFFWLLMNVFIKLN